MFGIDDAIIGGALSIFGGLFGGGEKETTSHVDYARMVKDAEAAGFNPLTAIRNGGSAGFTSTTMPGLSSGDYLADALKGVGQLVSNYDPMAKATADLEYKIKQETLANLQADTKARLRASIGGVPSSVGSNVVHSPGGMKPAKPKNLYEEWIDNSEAGGGKRVWLPSADAPDPDQAGLVWGTSAVNKGERLKDDYVQGSVRRIKWPTFSKGVGYKSPRTKSTGQSGGW